MAGQVTASPNEIFSKFNNADVKFGTILDEDGNEVELTNGRYSVFMESNDRSVRENAFKALYRQYGNFKNTLADNILCQCQAGVAFMQRQESMTPLYKCI